MDEGHLVEPEGADLGGAAWILDEGGAIGRARHRHGVPVTAQGTATSFTVRPWPYRPLR